MKKGVSNSQIPRTGPRTIRGKGRKSGSDTPVRTRGVVSESCGYRRFILVNGAFQKVIDADDVQAPMRHAPPPPPG